VLGLAEDFLVLHIRRDRVRFLTKHTGRELVERRAERAFT
jgi:hypothetical protein